MIKKSTLLTLKVLIFSFALNIEMSLSASAFSSHFKIYCDIDQCRKLRKYLKKNCPSYNFYEIIPNSEMIIYGLELDLNSPLNKFLIENNYFVGPQVYETPTHHTCLQQEQPQPFVPLSPYNYWAPNFIPHY